MACFGGVLEDLYCFAFADHRQDDWGLDSKRDQAGRA